MAVITISTYQDLLLQPNVVKQENGISDVKQELQHLFDDLCVTRKTKRLLSLSFFKSIIINKRNGKVAESKINTQKLMFFFP